MPTILITGSNKGIGLELTRQYLANGWDVHATASQPELAEESAQNLRKILSQLRPEDSGKFFKFFDIDGSVIAW